MTNARSCTITGTVVRWLLSVILWSALFVVFISVIPKQMKLFADFGMKLPAVTQITFDISMWFADYWWVMFPVFVMGLLLAGLVTYWVRHRTTNWTLMALWTFMLIGTPLVLMAIVGFSLYLPLLKLVEGLSR